MVAPHDDIWPSWVEVVGGTIAVSAVGALIWLAVADQSPAALTAITGIMGAATSTYFVPKQGLKQAPDRSNGNGNGNGNGSPPHPETNGAQGVTTSAPDAPPRA